MRVVVVGGGISGLTAAYLARQAGHTVLCIDSGAQPGGLISTERHEGFLCEGGPQAVLDNAPDTLALISALGLRDRVVAARPQSRRRFIYSNGALHLLPMPPPALLRSKLLSARGKLRLLAEPLVRAAARGDAETDADSTDDSETLEQFGVRRLGAEAARTLLATGAIGIYAADAAMLSARSAFPRLVAMEREHGSLLRGMMAAKKRRQGPGRPLSFPEGLGELPAAIVAALGPGSHTRARVFAIQPGAAAAWRVVLQGQADDQAKRPAQGQWQAPWHRPPPGPLEDGDAPSSSAVDADAVILAVSTEEAARILFPISPPAHQALTGMPSAPVAVCCFGFRDGSRAALGMNTDAYGFLVARGEGPLLLGCQFESSIFPERAPPGGVLLRAIMGGTGRGFDPKVVGRSDEELAASALADLATISGLKARPDLIRIWRYPRGIPLYAPGHASRVAALDRALRAHPGLFVIGHGMRGVGVNESVRAATALVQTVLSPGPGQQTVAATRLV